MPNHHDQNFKALMQERSFFEPFMRTYLPKEIQACLDWSTLEFYKMCGTHEEEKTGNRFEADLIYLAKMNNKTGLLWLHSEHQSRGERIMPLRILNYQVAELLNFAKANPGKKLPSIVTMIYHQGKKPWTHSLKLEDLFVEPELAIRYFGHPVLVDLPAVSDQELLAHPSIGPIEMILKHIRQSDFEKNMPILLTALRTVDGKSRRIVLKYVIELADTPKEKLFSVVKQCLTEDEELIMTVGEQLRAEGWHQGIQQGAEQKQKDIAKNLLHEGFDISRVAKLTGLSPDLIKNLI